MTPIQKIQLRMSELRQKINDMPEIRVDDADKLAERQKLVDELQGPGSRVSGGHQSRGRGQHHV